MGFPIPRYLPGTSFFYEVSMYFRETTQLIIISLESYLPMRIIVGTNFESLIRITENYNCRYIRQFIRDLADDRTVNHLKMTANFGDKRISVTDVSITRRSD